MGAPESGMQAAEQPAAETLLTAFRTINAAERRKHASVLNYWLSIRGNKEFPPLHDFDPLEISDFGPSSVLLELIGGGHDAEVRHLGEALQADGIFERVIDAPNPSVLASIARKLPIVAISREFLSFEDDLSTDGAARCWVTLLPLSSSGAWVDYVYAFVSVDVAAKAAETTETPTEEVPVDVPVDVVEDIVEEVADVASDEPEAATDAVEVGAEPPVETAAESADPIEAFSEEPEPTEAPRPGFAKLLEGFAGLAGFYGQGVKVDPVFPDEPSEGESPAAEPTVAEPPAEGLAETMAAEEPAAEEPIVEQPAVELAAAQESDIEPPALELTEQPAPATEGTLQSKLSEVRAMADEARAAKLKANMALYEGLSAAYDFALDAEDSPEEYLRLVEAQGMKIQLRAPMAPVVKLAFDGLCDESIIKQLEGVLAWALKQELPRGSLAARIEEAGGIAGILNGASQPS
jgi:hypothetical protein